MKLYKNLQFLARVITEQTTEWIMSLEIVNPSFKPVKWVPEA